MTKPDKTAAPLPVAALLTDRREHPGPLRRRISVRAASKRAEQLSGESFSEPTWRRIESGERRPDDREIVLMAAAINDLAMASVVTPDDLQKAGCEIAADLLREWIRNRTKADPALADIVDLTPESVQQALQGMLAEIRSLHVSQSDRDEMEKVLLSQIRSTLDGYRAQVRILRGR
ncbi:hypothetical protein ACQP1V_43110 (plasmid) [Microtetraspora malaysiensis]|uniref:hypothetical protein n=1 Tax=Microtetraspora malaysiensis TaxID=161358 RepID=UPI003D8B6327